MGTQGNPGEVVDMLIAPDCGDGERVDTYVWTHQTIC